MASTKTGSRLRILVPRLEFVQRGMITRHLRKEGMEVLPSAPSGKNLVRVLGTERPDAVVLDTEVARKAGADAIPAIRAATPGTKIVLITKGRATAKAFALGADANIKAGAEPGAISSLIVNLCGEPTIVLPESEVVATGPAEVGTAPVAPVASTAPPSPAPPVEPVVIPEAGADEREERRRRRVVLSQVLLGAGFAIVAVSLFAAAGLQARNETITAAEPIAAPTGGVLGSPAAGPTALDEASSTLDDLVAALRAGRYGQAQAGAQLLMDQRQTALQAGFSLFTLDADITRAIGGLSGDLTLLTCTSLTTILGDLMPACLPPADVGGAVIQPGETAGGGPTTPIGDGDGVAGGGGGAGGTPGTTSTFPGKGGHKGWEHKPPQGGWHGGPPPWVQEEKEAQKQEKVAKQLRTALARATGMNPSKDG